MSLAEVRSFFEAYRDAFNRLDGDAVADLWHTPSGITDTRPGDAQAALTFWPDEVPMRANQVALCEAYRRNHYARADFTLADNRRRRLRRRLISRSDVKVRSTGRSHCVELGANHAFANVHWSLWRSDGSLLQQFRTGYNLLRTVEGPKVLLCTAYEEDIKAMKRDAGE